MTLINKIVKHKMFGEGKVISETAAGIEVQFKSKVSKFTLPDAFDGFLVCEDAALQAELVAAAKAKKDATLAALLAKHEENKRAVQAGTVKMASKSTPSYAKYSSENNLAFKCNYCDGGCGDKCVGFKAVCSDEQIWYNIEKAKRTWCSNNDSPCKQYYNGEITREELDKMNTGTNFVCYEAKMLVDWRAEAGDDLDSDGNHKARRIGNAASDSLAVLTTEFPTDKQRYIFGVFITGTVDEGDDIQSGYVKAKGGFHIELTLNEAKEMPFWKYHKNKNSDQARWGMGLYRYMTDTSAARILADIVDLKSGEEKKQAQRVLEHYCELKGIDVDNIPEAEGVVT